GAGGHFCPVARALGARPAQKPRVVAQEIELALDARQQFQCRVRPEIVELLFCADFAGYGWCFRKGAFLNVGFGRTHARGFPSRRGACGRGRLAARRAPAALPSAWPGHAFLLYPSSRRRVVADGALLVGDAAGLAYAESGEGIRTAIESGLMAAETILAARGRY